MGPLSKPFWRCNMCRRPCMAQAATRSKPEHHAHGCEARTGVTWLSDVIAANGSSVCGALPASSHHVQHRRPGRQCSPPLGTCCWVGRCHAGTPEVQHNQRTIKRWFHKLSSCLNPRGWTNAWPSHCCGFRLACASHELGWTGTNWCALHADGLSRPAGMCAWQQHPADWLQDADKVGPGCKAG